MKINRLNGHECWSRHLLSFHYGRKSQVWKENELGWTIVFYGWDVDCICRGHNKTFFFLQLGSGDTYKQWDVAQARCIGPSYFHHYPIHCQPPLHGKQAFAILFKTTKTYSVRLFNSFWESNVWFVIIFVDAWDKCVCKGFNRRLWQMEKEVIGKINVARRLISSRAQLHCDE